MLTPAISASRTSAPLVRRWKASCTQVRGPRFLNLWPFPEAMTTAGVPATLTAGALRAAASTAAATDEPTNVRRLIFMGGEHTRDPAAESAFRGPGSPTAGSGC